MLKCFIALFCLHSRLVMSLVGSFKKYVAADVKTVIGLMAIEHSSINKTFFCFKS